MKQIERVRRLRVIHECDRQVECRSRAPCRSHGGSKRQDPPYMRRQRGAVPPGGSNKQDSPYVRRPGLVLETRRRALRTLVCCSCLDFFLRPRSS